MLINLYGQIENVHTKRLKEVGLVASVWNCSVFVLQTWRPFCNQFEGLVEDFNYGTLLRLDCEKGYTEENTIFGTFASLT